MIILEKIQQKITKEYLAQLLPKRAKRLAKANIHIPTNAYRFSMTIFLGILIGCIGIYFPHIPNPPSKIHKAVAPTMALKEYMDQKKSEPAAQNMKVTSPMPMIIVEEDQEERAIEVAKTGDLKTAITLYKDLLKETPGTPHQFFRLATLLQRNGQSKDAMLLYQKILAHQPLHMDALSNLVYILKDQDTDLAIRTLEKYAESIPESAKNYGYLSYLFGQLSDFDTALKYAARAQNMDPNDPILLFNLAILYEHVGAKTQAKNAYTILLQHHTNADLPWADIRKKI